MPYGIYNVFTINSMNAQGCESVFSNLSIQLLFTTKQEKFTVSLQLLSSFTISSLFLPYQTELKDNNISDPVYNPQLLT